MEGSLIFSLSLHALTNGSSSAIEDLYRVHPIFCLFVLFSFACLFVFVFFLQLMSRSLSHRLIKAVLPSNQQDFWNCHNGYSNNRQE